MANTTLNYKVYIEGSTVSIVDYTGETATSTEESPEIARYVTAQAIVALLAIMPALALTLTLTAVVPSEYFEAHATAPDSTEV